MENNENIQVNPNPGVQEVVIPVTFSATGSRTDEIPVAPSGDLWGSVKLAQGEIEEEKPKKIARVYEPVKKIEDMPLGDRMKAYENHDGGPVLDPVLPAIIRCDGKAFHTYTRGFKKPFDEYIFEAMSYSMRKLCDSIQNCRICYTQSDEISILMTTHETLSMPWFGGKKSKIESIASSMVSIYFNEYMNNVFWIPTKYKARINEDKEIYERLGMFDARVFNIPMEEVNNYFIWREQDAIRNSIQAVAHSKYSQKQLHKKNQAEMIEMLAAKEIDYYGTIPLHFQRGFCCVRENYQVDGATRSKWVFDRNIPVFKDDRDYMDKFVKSEVQTEQTSVI